MHPKLASLLVILLAAAGQAFAAGFPASLPLSALDGVSGTRIDGINGPNALGEGDLLGSAIATGDFNGDGYTDIALGAPSGIENPGRVYIVFGKAGGLSHPFDLNGPGVSRLVDSFGSSQMGYALAAGDLDGDGIDDLAIGAPAKGKIFIVYGTRAGFPATIDLATTVQLQGGIVLQSGGITTAFGQGDGISLGIGDVTGDGRPDLIVGRGDAGTDRMGCVARLPGRMAAGSYLLKDYCAPIVGAGASEGNFQVAAIGDVTGDGIGDLLIGSPSASMAYFVPGGPALSLGVDVTTATKLVGVLQSAFGSAVAGIGDIDGDGYRDFAIGAPMDTAAFAGTESGRVFVAFGRPGYPASIDVTALNGNNGGFQILGAQISDRLGTSVAAAGDVNADGVADLLVGAPSSATANGTGNAYVIFGRHGFFSNMSLNPGQPTSLNGSNGFRLAGVAAGDRTGRAVAAARDVDGDGMSDILVGADRALNTKGSVFLVYGRETIDPTIVGSRSPAANAYGWNKTAVTVSFACADGQSGIKSCTPATTLATEGANQSVTGTAVDFDGNTATTTVGGISIDLRAPQVAVTGVVAGETYRTAPSPGCASSDPLSGLAKPAVSTVVAGATVKNLAAYTASCAGAEDKAGNIAPTVSVTYYVKVKR